MSVSRVTTSSVFAGTVIADQFESENSAVLAGVQRYRRLQAEIEERGDVASLKPAERMLLHWLHPMILAIRKENRQIRAGKAATGRSLYGPYLVALEPDRTAVAALWQAISFCTVKQFDDDDIGEGVKLVRLAYEIGVSIISEIHVDLLRRHDRQVRADLRSNGRDEEARKHKSALRQIDSFVRRTTPRVVNWMAGKTLEDPVYSRQACVGLGSALIAMMAENCAAGDYEDFEPAFEIRQIPGSYKVVRMADAVLDIIAEGHLLRETMRPIHKPMLVPPLPRDAEGGGGYYKNQTPFISALTPTQRARLEQADLTEVQQRINIVDATAWQLIPEINELQCEIWDQGGGIAGVPHADNKPIPERPPGEDGDRQVEEWRSDAHQCHKENRRRKGRRVQFAKIRAVAEEFSDVEQFWQPHYLDFRGRFYPRPVYLNHQGHDLARGQMRYAEGKRLGQRGLYWLAVHAANMWGFDKGSFDQRQQWVEDNWPLVFAASRRPRETMDAWTQAKKPWQFLAACFELEAATRLAEPSRFISHIPVQMDGSCSALQHYAAMLRDPVLAKLVNMMPSDVPQDLYTVVMAEVRDLVATEADQGDPLAGSVIDHVVRDVVKQPIMTLSYGVTAVGARRQIEAKLVKRGVPDDRTYESGRYLARKINEAARRLCPSAIRAMECMRRWAQILTTKKKGSKHVPDVIEWESPLGMPVIQGYRTYRTKEVRTVLGRVSTLIHEEKMPPRSRNQQQGIAPNFVHMIDSTHALMISERFHHAGIVGAYVHDSIWSHACDVDLSHRIIRECMVRLHRTPLLHELHQQLQERNPNVSLPRPPDLGDFDLDLIKDATYCFN